MIFTGLAVLVLSGNTPIRPPDLPFLLVTDYLTVNSIGTWFREISTGNLDIEFEQNVAMSGFELGFGKGNDHQISKIGVEPETERLPGHVHFTFHENDDDDFFRPFYTYLAFDGNQSRRLTSSMVCEGSCIVPIDFPRGGEAFVLSGFSIDQINDRSNLRKLSIRPYNRGNMRVEFADNGSKRYRVQLHYLYIQESLVAGRNTVSVARRQDSGERLKLVSREPGQVLLQGFEFEFLNGDHRIGEISLLADSPSSFLVKFNDQNADDPYHVEIDYIILQP